MTFVDNVLSFLTKDFIGGGVDVVFETMYRSNWYSAKPFYFMVKDWEPCNGQWIGTITYTTTLKEVGSAEDFMTKRSWKDDTFYEATAQLDGRRDNLGAPIARVTATASERKERSGSGKRSCTYKTTQITELKGSGSETTTGFTVSMNPRSGKYLVSAPIIMVNASGRSSVDKLIQGTCNNPYNKDAHESNPESWKLGPEGPIVYGDGAIDPNNPDKISGTNSVTVNTNRGGERKVTITWDLRRCKDQ